MHEPGQHHDSLIAPPASAGGPLYRCTSLTSANLPNNVTSIRDSAFSYCNSLTSVTIPSSVTSIGSGAFYSCTSLTDVVIPKNVTRIWDQAFNYCSSLASATFMGNAPAMDLGVFDNTASGFTVYYFNGRAGFTSPTWSPTGNDGYPATGSPAPYIALEQPAGTGLADGGTRDFGAVEVGNSATSVFTIRNTGDLSLTGILISKDGSDSGDFSVGSLGAPMLAPGTSTTFSVTFTPAAPGPRIAALHIASNDPTNNPFDVNLTGIGIAAGKDILTFDFGASGPATITGTNIRLTVPYGTKVRPWRRLKTFPHMPRDRRFQEPLGTSRASRLILSPPRMASPRVIPWRSPSPPLTPPRRRWLAAPSPMTRAAGR